MDDLQARHRKEQRELQSRATQLKKSANKKTRKTVNAECEALERELKVRQAREITELPDDGAARSQEPEEVDLATENADESSAEALALTATSTLPSATPQPRKPNRQKARLARRAQELETQIAEAEAEAANMPDRRQQEREGFEKSFDTHGLELKEIRPDGHCLYSAVADQLQRVGVVLELGTDLSGETVDDYRTIRRVAADYMAQHPDDFEAFMEDSPTEHVRKVRETAEWGGQLELLALARAYGVRINVLQGDGRIEKIEPLDEIDNTQTKEIWLGYYRHVYGLGEHYNSLRTKR